MPKLHPTHTLKLMAQALFVIALAAGFHLTYAQQSTEAEPAASPSPSPENEELKRLKERNAILDEQKKIAESETNIEKAKKEKLETQFPKPSATPLEGKTEVDSGVKIESEMAAYASMHNAADLVVKELKEKVPGIQFLAIYNPRDIKSLLGYTVIDSQINLMIEKYTKLFAQEDTSTTSGKRGEAAAFIAPMTIATSVLGSFIDLIALFRTDTTVKGMTFDVAESALVAETFRALKNDDHFGSQINLYYPAVFPPNLNVNRQYVILGKIEVLHDEKVKADRLSARITETEKALKEVVGEIAGLKKTLAQIKNDIPLLDRELERLQKVYWRWPSSRLAERIEETSGRIEKLKGDEGKAKAALAEQTELKTALEERLEQLYNELAPEANISEEIVAAAIAEAEKKLEPAEKILGRAFTADEKKELFGAGFSELTSTKLIEEAEKNLPKPKKGKAKLTEAQKSTLLQPPLSKAEKTALARKEKGEALTDAERLAISPDEQKAAVRSQREQSLAELKALNVQFEKLVGELIKVDDNVGINALTSYIQAENLKLALGCQDPACEIQDFDNSYWMQLRVVRAGGNNKVKRNLITTIFTGDNISHSGGSIVEYILYDVNGNARWSDTVSVYEDYKKAKDIKTLTQKNQPKSSPDKNQQKVGQ